MTKRATADSVEKNPLKSTPRTEMAESSETHLSECLLLLFLVVVVVVVVVVVGGDDAHSLCFSVSSFHKIQRHFFIRMITSPSKLFEIELHLFFS